ncbi:HlyD family type I secretion periplasmic adaptor subunit [Variovorax sp. J22R133]|uniref:HlyD family type I secretion periplasmic adaptor subunit n=1 Tax=Variovorax brevis TaxID=3053503 RepID=UPI0025780DC6|nr:HlyD family type I secretion periplasmic adaptor subunit [Variovorax sp. J22R133]MDM0111538.1 HlyD family type I secretion periplasmic adaptor subunit [Variovorax sp. J22R133]
MTDELKARPLPTAHPDPDRGPQRTVLAMVGLVGVFLLVAIVWASVANLDVAVQVKGVVTPPSKLQEVQSLEGGIVEEMLVAPGEKVKKGQLLVRLDTAQYTSGRGESRQRYLAALAGRARTDALLNGGEPLFASSWRAEAPDLIEKETQLWRDGLREFRATVDAAREGSVRRSAELREAQARIQSLAPAIKVGEESFAIEENLFKEGAGARADYLGAQQKLLGQKAELDALRQSIPRLRAGLAEADAQAAQATSRLRAQWGAERSEFETKVTSIAATLEGHEDKVARRELTSPVDGVVNRVLIPTRNGVAQPGKPILEIVPEESMLQMSARVLPVDVGFLRPGQAAHVRVLAYDSATYGQMDATLDRIGADAITDEKGESYFEVQLSAARDQLKLHGKPLAISAGMPLDVSILTGERSVMQYLLKPVLRGVQGALQER